MKITRLLCTLACVHCLASCIVTGHQKVALSFRDRHTLKPVEGMKVKLEWSDESPWRAALPNTGEGLTDSRGIVTFESLAESYWIIRAYRPGRQIGRLDFWIDVTQGVRFYCQSSREIESHRLVMNRDRDSPFGPAPDVVMTAVEICPDGAKRNAVANTLRSGVFKLNRDENYEHIKLRDD